MIKPLPSEIQPGGERVHIAKVDGEVSLDIQRLTATMAILETYVDRLLAHPRWVSTIRRSR